MLIMRTLTRVLAEIIDRRTKYRRWYSDIIGILIDLRYRKPLRSKHIRRDIPHLPSLTVHDGVHDLIRTLRKIVVDTNKDLHLIGPYSQSWILKRQKNLYQRRARLVDPIVGTIGIVVDI